MYSVGFEANGGFLLASDVEHDGRTLAALPTRDSVLPMICALVAAHAREGGLDALVNTLPRRFTLSDRLVDMPTAQSQAQIARLAENPADGAATLGFTQSCGALSHVDETDGLRMTFDTGEIIHLRPSGNAPELRVYVEADSPRRAAELLQTGMDAISVWRHAPVPV